MNTKVKILVYTTLFPSSSRPCHGIFVKNRLRHLLATCDVEAKVVAPVPWFPFTHDIFGIWSSYAKIPSFEYQDGLEIFHPRYPLPPKIGMSIAPFLMAIFSLSTVLKLKHEYDFDLIDAHYYYPDGVAATFISKTIKKPIVITARGTDLNFIPKYLVPRYLIKWAISQANASIGVCKALVEILVQLNAKPENCRVLRNGINLSLFSPIDQIQARKCLGISSKKLLLSVGLLTDRKGHDIAIRALQQLPDVVLAIIGDGEMHHRLEAIARQYDVTDRVKFIGQLPQESLPVWYSAADALVLCSSREGWANVLLESLACGTPVVATKIWGTPEIIKESVAGRLMSERTPEALIHSVNDLFLNYPNRNDVRGYAEQFSWDETSHGQFKLFLQVLNKDTSLVR